MIFLVSDLLSIQLVPLKLLLKLRIVIYGLFLISLDALLLLLPSLPQNPVSVHTILMLSQFDSLMLLRFASCHTMIQICFFNFSKLSDGLLLLGLLIV